MPTRASTLTTSPEIFQNQNNNHSTSPKSVIIAGGLLKPTQSEKCRRSIDKDIGRNPAARGRSLPQLLIRNKRASRTLFPPICPRFHCLPSLILRTFFFLYDLRRCVENLLEVAPFSNVFLRRAENSMDVRGCLQNNVTLHVLYSVLINQHPCKKIFNFDGEK